MIGTRLGSYEIIEQVGKGGMATVYRAYQPSMDRHVAVKVIHKSIAEDAQAFERFRREARIIARLEHPHILPVYDFDGAHDPPYIVMRYVDGGTLKDVLSIRRLPSDEVGHLLRQMAGALDYAHRQGVVHRDIKPSNIMLDREGNALVSDFGIARLTTTADQVSAMGLTQSGSFLGTPAYMSPEQVKGIPVDHRADLYSLGVMVFEILTGQLPYTHETITMVLMKHLQDPIPSAVAVNPDLPPVIDAVLARALAKEPDQRYSSAGELAAAVVEALGGAVAGTPTGLRAAVQESAVIARLKRESGQTPPDKHTPTEQNKVVTAMYVNAADYAGLVEDAHRAIGELWAEAEKIVGQSGGQMFTRTEDTLLALWGAETSHENDPERAIRAALDIQAALRRLGAGVFEESPDEPLPLKIGVSTGPALLAPAPGTERGYTASGATISLANRLSENADGIILIAPDTFRAVLGVFDIEPDEPIRVRGRVRAQRAAPLQTYRVTAAKARSLRREAWGFEGIEIKLIGREAELKQMQEAFLTAVEDSETQLVTVVSEAGLGKSRLLFEFGKWAELRPERFRLFRGRAAPEMPPYGLLRDVLSYRFEIHDNDSPAVAREKLEKGVAELAPGTATETAHLIGQLAGFDLAESPHVKPLLPEPQELVKRARAAFLRLFTTLCQNQPAVVELEDLHHADDATLDLFDELVHTHRDLRLLVVCAARPVLYERRPAWGSGHDDVRLDLRPLSKREGRLLVREILQKATEVPKALLDLVVERAEGNPYYTEELVKALIEDRIIQKGGEVWTVEETRLEAWQRSVPPTLVGLLQTRLDGLLYPERVVLQRAATIGRVFWDSAVKALEAGDSVQLTLAETLAALVRREFIYERPTSAFVGSRECAFVQAMLRDVVHDSLVKRQQRAYHAAAAEWLAQAAGERVTEYAALIADHYEHAGENVKAAQYLLQAARQANAVSAFSEAIATLERALTLTPQPPLPKLGEGAGGEGALRISILVLLGDVHSWGKAAYAEANKYLQQAMELARTLGDRRGLANALGRLARVAYWQGEYMEGRAYLQEALPLARTLDDRSTLVFILRQLGNIADDTGAFAEATAYLEESLALAREMGDRQAVADALLSLGTAAGYQGDYARAIRRIEEALEIARALGDRSGAAMSLMSIGFVYCCGLKDYAAAVRFAQESLDVARAIGDNYDVALALYVLGEAALGLGQAEAARSYLDESLRLLHAIRLVPYILGCLPIYARLSVQAGPSIRALELLGLALAHPAANPETRRNANAALADSRAGVPDAEVEAALSRGAQLDLDAVVRELLGE
jgi:predicted ATPase/class 3 adenylate cyclase/tRNA A-37 threonylcarbamoyl transferase component Bud32